MAVYTTVTKDEASAFLADYDIGRLVTLDGIRDGVSNTNYHLMTNRGRYILTLYEERVAVGDLPFFLGLMRHLATSGFPCPPPIAANDGALYRPLAGKTAALTGFIDGTSLTNPTIAQVGQVGRAMAQLHLDAADFPLRRVNALSFAGWEKLAADCLSRADEVAPGLARTILDELVYLHAQWPHDLPHGIIHADLFHDNVFFNDGKLSAVIDFYYACEDFLAYDIAVCLNAWCFGKGHAFDPARSRALIEGYHAVRPLSGQELRCLPVLARGAALRFLLTRLYDLLHVSPDAVVKRHDPKDFITRLEYHRQAASPAAYGLAA